MAKKVRIKTWQEKGASATNMADRFGCQGRLGRQKLTKEFFLATFFAFGPFFVPANHVFFYNF